GSAVKGWHVDVYWPGKQSEAYGLNDTKGGTRTVTIAGTTPGFVAQSASSPPTNPSVSLQSGQLSLSRYVTLNLSAEDPQESVTGMMVSNSELFTDAFEEPYASTKSWTLTPGDGPKTVYARFKNASGAWSDVAKVETNLQEQPPVGSVTVAPDPQLLLSARLAGNTLPAIGASPRATGHPQYRPLGPNLLANSSFEDWAGGIPAGWDSALREEAYTVYEPSSTAYHGSLSLVSASTDARSELVQKVVIKPGTEYTLSARVQGTGGRLGLEELETQGVNSRSLAVHTVGTKAGKDWQLVQLTFKSSASATDAAVSLRGDRVQWDAIQLEEGGTPSTYRSDGVLLEGAARNQVTNPSLERGARGWSGLNSWVTVVSSPDYARYGRKALLVHKAKPGFAATVLPVQTEPGKQYTFSVYVRLDTGQPVSNDVIRGWIYQGATSVKQVENLTFGLDNRPTMAWAAVGGGWHRGTFTFTATRTSALVGVLSSDMVGVGDEFYLDGAQLEAGAYATSYVDGSLGSGYAWKGKPFISTSERAAVGLKYGAKQGKQGSLVFWARPEGAASNDAELLSAGNLSLKVTASGLKLVAAGRTVGVAPWSRGEARLYAVTWDGNRVSFYSQGRLIAGIEAPAPAPASQLVLGPTKGSAYPNAVVGDVSLWRKPLAEPEIRYLSLHSPLDPGRPRVNSRYTEVETGATDSTQGDITVEWSADGRSWYRWDDVQGRHPWD
ncbi:MAG: hypothetical protein M3281_06825, partial [Chloroflexota bacterium]|nr:hypothetical protein [Chloroflexota bacterium]